MTFEFPTEDNHFQARFNPWIGVVLIFMGLLFSRLALRTILVDQVFSLRLFLGILLAAVGLLYLKRPYFRIAPNRLTVYSFYGQVVKRHPFAKFNDISINSGKVYLQTSKTENPKRVKIQQWMTKPSDWKTFKRLTET